MNGASAEITDLDPADLPRLESLLQSQGLPTDDCRQQLEHFVAVYDGEQLVAAGGLEPAGNCGLLRSLVVVPDRRGQGLGARLTEYLLERARTRQFEAVYLLTESADSYFPRHGFEVVARAEVPPAVAATRQFASLCPDSAACLCHRLQVT